MLILSLIIIIFSNQYLLFNEELFIILGFFCLCYIVKTNLGTLVENELYDRKNKVTTSYLEFLEKKSKYLNINVKNISQKVEYLYNYSKLQQNYFNSFSEMFSMVKSHNIVDLKKNFELNFILYFAALISKKRKFL